MTQQPNTNIHSDKILILDFGAQYTQLIARRIREIGVYCEIWAWDHDPSEIAAFGAKGIILSGGPESTTLPGAPAAPQQVFDSGLPLLGICYGMQTLAAQLGGATEAADQREFGHAEVEITTPGGDRIVAVVTEGSVQSLGLAVGKPAMAFVKAPWVIVMTDKGGTKLSARNQLAGVVQHIEKGAINSEIAIKLPGGTLVHAVITNEAVMELGLKPDAPASALIKASHVVIGVRD